MLYVNSQDKEKIDNRYIKCIDIIRIMLMSRECFICTRDICNIILQAMDATLCYARPHQVARRAACTAARHTCAGRRD